MNALFPATYSTLCPDALSIMLAVKYSLPDVTCSLMVRGVGDTYLVTSGTERSILRIYRATHRTFNQIKAETELLTALKEAGVKVSWPIPDSNGSMIQALEAVEGTRHAVLFTYAAGKPIAAMNEQQLRNLGKEMARFHNISSDIQLSDPRWTFDFDTTLSRPLEMARKAFDSDPETYAWLQQSAQKMKKALSERDGSSFSSGYCHYDFLPKNFHFDGDEIMIFDFDFFGYGWLVNDLMVYRQHLWLDVFFNRTTKQIADDSFATFLASYREHRAISDEEIAVIPYLTLGFWLFYMGFHTTHDQFYEHVYNPAQLKLRMGLIRQVVESNWPAE